MLKAHEINGEVYSDKPIHHIKKKKYVPSTACFNSLESIVKMIKTEAIKQRAIDVSQIIKKGRNIWKI